MSKAILADCMEFMANVPDKYFDLVPADPPYFSGPEKREYYGGKTSSVGVTRKAYPVTDTWNVPNAEYMKEVVRISKHQIVWGINYYDFNPGPGRIIWDKVNNASSYSDCEIAYCSIHDSVRLFRYMWNGMNQGSSIFHGHIMQGNKKLNEKRIHPTQKPVNLYKWIYHTYGFDGMRVYDTHLGSGSSRIAADEMPFDIDFIGTELSMEHLHNHNKRYYEYIKSKEKQLVIEASKPEQGSIW